MSDLEVNEILAQVNSQDGLPPLELGAFVLCNFALLSIIAAIGYSVKSYQFRYRLAIASVVLLAYQQLFQFPLYYYRLRLACPNLQIWTGVYILCQMQLASAIGCMAGADLYCASRGIDHIWKAMFAALWPAKVYFLKSEPQLSPKLEYLKKLLQLSLLWCVGRVVFVLMRPFPYPIDGPKLDYTLINVVKCFYINLHICIYYPLTMGAIPLIIALLFVPNSIRIVEPYSPTILLSTSIREFWQQFSSIATEAYRYGVYLPLGGKNSPIIAPAAVFVVNCVLHFDVSMQLVGDRQIMAWCKGFPVLAFAAVFEMWINRIVPSEWKKEWWWAAIGATILHCSMAVGMCGAFEIFAPLFQEPDTLRDAYMLAFA